MIKVPTIVARNLNNLRPVNLKPISKQGNDKKDTRQDSNKNLTTGNNRYCVEYSEYLKFFTQRQTNKIEN